MRYFLDTEFHEDGRIIDLISIAIVAEDGREYYAVSNEFNPDVCNDFVKTKVLPHLSRGYRRSRKDIAHDIVNFVGRPIEGMPYVKPEFWAYFADYDWVVLCQLYGRMVDLPKGFPYYCLDLKQLMHMEGVDKAKLPKQAGTHHDALEDARWVRDAYKYIVTTRGVR